MYIIIGNDLADFKCLVYSCATCVNVCICMWAMMLRCMIQKINIETQLNLIKEGNYIRHVTVIINMYNIMIILNDLEEVI